MLDYATIKIGYMLSNTVLYILPQSWSAKILGKDFASERTRRIKRNFSKRVAKLYCLSYLIFNQRERATKKLVSLRRIFCRI